MIIKYFIQLFLLLQTVSFTTVSSVSHINNATISQQQDYTTIESDQDLVYEDDGFSLMLLFLLIFALICIGVGITLTIIVLVIIFGLIGAGILSASILIGLHKKSFSKGFKAFLLSSCTIGGLIIGLLSFWAIHEFLKWWSLSASLISGGITGIIAGFLLGCFAYYVIQKLTSFFKTKLKNNNKI